MTGIRSIPKHAPTLLGVGLLVTAALISCAIAFTVTGGTSSQRAQVQQVISECWMPSSVTDQELRSLGPVKVILCPIDGVSGYSEWGRMFVNSQLTGDKFTEIVAHEWCHQIWYTLGPKWWAKWADICNGTRSSIWTQDYYENFAECAKVAFFPSDVLYRPYAVTDLRTTTPAAVKNWVTLARYANKCPFPDLQPTVMQTDDSQDELAAAGGYVAEQGLVSGFPDSNFHAYDPVLRRQLALVCERAGASYPEAWQYDYSPATRADVRDTLAVDWNEARWDQSITRGQLARLLWRAR
jgi:hypothetical protein